MTKNKKGKKKNKMATRNRNNQQQRADGDEKKPFSDNSETEDPNDLTHMTPTPEPQASDSGIDSGRGSPGDESVPGSTNIKVDVGATTIEDQSTVETGRKPKLEVEAEQPNSETRLGAGPRSQKPVGRPDDRMNVVTDGRTQEQPDGKSQHELDKRSSEKTRGALQGKSDTWVKGKSVETVGDDSDNLTPKKSDDRIEEKSQGTLGKSVIKVEVKTEGEIVGANKKTEDESGKRGGDPAGDTAVRRRGASSLKKPKPMEDIKHPLEFAWDFWAVTPEVHWSRALQHCVMFDTIEDFWVNFNEIRDPRIAQKPILMFKNDIRPEWEHPRNATGGRWNFAHGLHGPLAADVWRELALMLIGGIKFGSLTPHINGLFCTWKGDGLHYSVWLDTTREDIVMSIGNTIHETLRSVLNKSFVIEFVLFTGPKVKKRALAVIK
ncbi:uncharacterized protein LOC100900107 [Galendromus occidentalis]|uniref:Uncharacterized protein LOC100900107 n=1 Tax=Galendromus occidentalis TaxID=34638 RepID=A0AAJ6QQD4_9ACAR|nr:uncharacterized protein LOC100900107 [Galendromus occidentalis]